METAAIANRDILQSLGYSVIDADAHMMEPHDLWSTRIDQRFADGAPKVVTEYKGKAGLYWVFDGDAIAVQGSREGADKSLVRAGGYDPVERLKDMEIDGIAAAVLYSTRAFNLFGTDKGPLQEACFRVYNDWLAEFCSHSPRHFAGLALISLYDIANGVKELERCHKAGLKGAAIWAAPPDDKPPYSGKDYDPLWAAAQACGMPLSLHTNTRAGHNKAYSADNFGNWAPYYTSMVMQQAPLQESILQMTFGAVFERFPGLKMVCAEGDTAWMGPLMARADKYYASRLRRGHDLKLSMLPSEYLHRQVYLTFIKDPFGLQIYQHANLADRLMWSTDYPHPACFFPKSLEVLRRDFAGVPDRDKKKIVHDNVAELYGFSDI